MNNRKPKILFFDIDHTLFDTEAYKAKIFSETLKLVAIKKPDVTLKTIESIYATVRKSGNFIPYVFAKELIESLSLDGEIDSILKIIWNKKNFQENFYPKVAEVLLNLNKQRIPIGILTTGDKEFQNKKIDITREYLDKDNIYIADNKTTIMKDVFSKHKDKNVYFVDNLLTVLKFAKEIDSSITTILKNTSELLIPEKSHKGTMLNYEINDLQDIINIVI